jgi:hypothetical protein
MVIQNNSVTALSSVGTIPPYLGWVVTAGIFVAVFVTIFLLSKNVRQFIYGSIISTILILNYNYSRFVGTNFSEGNFEPIKWAGYVIGFIVLSIILGRIVQRFKFVKNFENKMKDMQKE